MGNWIVVTSYVCHSKRVWKLAEKFGWLPGARYTNLRDVRDADRLGFLDINWKDYNYEKHLEAAKATCPRLTVAQDVVDIDNLRVIIQQAWELLEYSDNVIVVPKDPKLTESFDRYIPADFVIGYSVPTKYGGTAIPVNSFVGRSVHLLGGRPDRQRQLADHLKVVSIDTNRFTLDASFGDYFDGDTFRPHPRGGYERCLEASLQNINALWHNYEITSV